MRRVVLEYQLQNRVENLVLKLVFENYPFSFNSCLFARLQIMSDSPVSLTQAELRLHNLKGQKILVTINFIAVQVICAWFATKFIFCSLSHSKRRIYPKKSIISHIPTTVCSERIMMFH